MSGRARIVVYHADYGCDTGCCGHIVETSGSSEFLFAHPYGVNDSDHAALREWAEEKVTQVFGAEHVADLDWDNCRIVTDC